MFLFSYADKLKSDEEVLQAILEKQDMEKEIGLLDIISKHSKIHYATLPLSLPAVHPYYSSSLTSSPIGPPL